MRRFIFVLALGTSVLGAQTGKVFIPPPISSISGRVFAITNGGDLKPARMAKIYVLFGGPANPNKEEHPREPDTPAALFDNALTTATSEFRERASKSGDSWSEQDLCRSDKNTYDVALLNVLNWAAFHKRENASEII